ncbi:MAG TPA: serine/threonine-protein kinase [Gemmatimonadaceae bacterium]|nr:serine/threonine-protein kinase [Gemmatimonadaceae bacterium]
MADLRRPDPAVRSSRRRLPGRSALVAFGLTWRVFVGTAAIVTMVLAAALLVASNSVRRAGDESMREALEQSTDLVAQFLAGRERSLGGGARVFVQRPYFRALVAEQRRDDLLDQAFEAAAQLEADWVLITDERGVLVAKSDEPGATGEAMGAIPLVAGALRGRPTSGFGVSRDTLLFQAVAVPIAIPGGAPIGALIATKLVDSIVVRDVRAATAGDVIFYTRDLAGRPHIAASSLGRGSDVATALAALVALGAPAEPPAASPRVEIAGASFVGQGGALASAGGELLGGFVVLRSRDAAAGTIAGMRRSLVVAGLLGLGLAFLAAYAAAHHVTRPVRALAAAANRAAEGIYDPEALDGLARSGDDEIGVLAAAVRTMLADLRDTEALVAVLRGASTRRVPGAAAAGPQGATSAAAGAHRPPVEGGGGRFAPAGAAPECGSRFAGRYDIQAVIGRGGMGVVHRAVDTVLGELVAVKTLKPDLVRANPTAVDRFKDELRLARRISHRNVVRVHDIGEAHGVPFITMELVDGASLAAVIDAHGPLPLAAVVSIARQLCRALTVAHEQGVVHGDVKPANLLLGRGGVLKVTDFGVARLAPRPSPPPPRWHVPDGRGGTRGDARLAGAVVGTPEYMAPEQLLGAPPDPRADVYAAGVVLHECLTGVTPFQADTPMGFMARKLGGAGSSAPRPRLDRGVSSALEALIACMTAHDPAARPPAMSELAEQFALLR